MASDNVAPLGKIVSARIETGLITARCPWPNKHFPLGFEFRFESLRFNRLEECPDEKDNGATVFNPDRDNPYVRVLINDQDAVFPDEMQKAIDDEHMMKVPFTKCEDWLGVTHWKMIDVLDYDCTSQLNDAISETLLARDYTVITMCLVNGVYHEARETMSH